MKTKNKNIVDVKSKSGFINEKNSKNCSRYIYGVGSKCCAGGDYILNVSYDPTREFYQEYNQAFGKFWKQRTGQDVDFKQSHGGSGKQARAVATGLEADVVTLALANDIDEIVKAGFIQPNWQKNSLIILHRIPLQLCFSTKRQSKNIRDWNDLTKPGVEIITPNPKRVGHRVGFIFLHGDML